MSDTVAVELTSEQTAGLLVVINWLLSLDRDVLHNIESAMVQSLLHGTR